MTTIPFVEEVVMTDLGSPEWYEVPSNPTQEQLDNLSAHVQGRQAVWCWIAQLNFTWRGGM